MFSPCETPVCVCVLWCVQVLLELTRQVDQEKTILCLSVCQLGAEGKRRSFDLNVTSYLRRVTLDYCDVPGDVQLTDVSGHLIESGIKVSAGGQLVRHVQLSLLPDVCFSSVTLSSDEF